MRVFCTLPLFVNAYTCQQNVYNAVGELANPTAARKAQVWPTARRCCREGPRGCRDDVETARAAGGLRLAAAAVAALPRDRLVRLLDLWRQRPFAHRQRLVDDVPLLLLTRRLLRGIGHLKHHQRLPGHAVRLCGAHRAWHRRAVQLPAADVPDARCSRDTAEFARGHYRSTRGHPRSPEIARDHPRSPEITRDHPRSPEIARDRPRSPEAGRGR